MDWLKKHKLDFSFHDYRQEGISKEKLEAWCNAAGWETIFNKRSTTWRQLTETEQQQAVNQAAAIKLMLQHNSIIKRPVIEAGKKLVVGFKETEISKQIK